MRSELERRLAVLVEPLERAVLDGVREFEADPGRTRVELGLIPVFADERPLVGLAGLIDWRSSGRLSAELRSGFFRGDVGEQLLMPGERRWPVDRLVLLGLGPRAEFNDQRARELGSRSVEIAAGLSAASVLIALPGTSVERSLVELAFESLLEAIEREAVERAQEILAIGAQDEGEIAGESGGQSERADAHAEVELAERDAHDDHQGLEGHGVPGKDAIPSEREGAEPLEGQADPVQTPPKAELDPGDGQPEAGKAEHEGQAAVEVEEPREAPPALESQGPEPLVEAKRVVPRLVARVDPRWWVVVDETLVARLRRVRSGPPRAARGGPSLHT